MTDIFITRNINSCYGYVLVCCPICQNMGFHGKTRNTYFFKILEAVSQNILNKSYCFKSLLQQFPNKYYQNIFLLRVTKLNCNFQLTDYYQYLAFWDTDTWSLNKNFIKIWLWILLKSEIWCDYNIWLLS